MKPILFAENSTSWNTNGLGRLSDSISCKVKEQRNGEYELELIYPTSGKHFADISVRKIIAAIPSQGSTLQPFRIYRITRPIRGKVTVKARHISYDLSKYVATPFSVTASSGACASVLSNLKSRSVKSCPFTFWTDVTTVASYSQKTPASIRQRLGGIEGSVLDQYGGEYEWDGMTVKLHHQRGSATNYTLRYGKNITDVTQDENIAETATGVVPFWTDVEADTVITGNVIEKQGVSYSSPLIVPLDLSSEWQSPPTVAQLNAAARVYVNKSEFGIPKVSVNVSFINLADTEEYKDIIPMQSLRLCDTVKVQFEELGIDTTAKVVETVYDVLAERYESIQIGSLKSTLAGLITDYEASMVQTVSDTGKRVFAEANTEAQDLINNATAWLTASGGYVIAVKNNDGSWKELLFLDTNDVQTAHNVLRINQNGIGFSSNGVGGPYTQAWTLDGRLVIGGTNVPSITVYDNNNNIIFQASATGAQFNNGIITLRDANSNLIFQASAAGVIWNAKNSSMDSNGKITANEAVINGRVTTSSPRTAYRQTYNRLVVIDEGQIKFTNVLQDGTEIASGTIAAGVRGSLSAGIVSGKMVYEAKRIDIRTPSASQSVSSATDESIFIDAEDVVGITGTKLIIDASNYISVDSVSDITLRSDSTISIVAPDIYLSGNVHYTN